VSLIENIRKYMSSCPLLDGGSINIDFLSSSNIEYTIETVPCEPVIKYFIGGSSLRQYEFILASREFYGTDVVQNIQNSEFYENLAHWIEENSKNKILPVLENEKQSADKIEILTHGALISEDAKTAVYQIQLRLIYFQLV